jgi:pterin-4a-carbinolamine dehydratase
MPRLDDTAVEEGLQRLPGWERRGNQIAKTFVREDFEDVPRPVELWWRPIG